MQLSKRWGEKIVKKFEDSVETALLRIAQNPFIYPVIEEVTGSRSCVLHKNYSMIYQVKDNVVRVICFWDNRQNPLFY